MNQLTLWLPIFKFLGHEIRTQKKRQIKPTQTYPKQYTLSISLSSLLHCPHINDGEPEVGHGLCLLGPQRFFTSHPRRLRQGHPRRPISSRRRPSQPSPQNSATLSFGKWVPSRYHSFLLSCLPQGLGLFLSSVPLAQTIHF